MPAPERIKLLVLDVDGVMTDGTLNYDNHGNETKRFHVRDGFGIRAAKFAGIKVGVLTGRSGRAVTLRMSELEIDLFVHGQDNKAIGIETITKNAGVEPEDTAYLGDDVLDLPAMVRCGYPMAVADAAEEVRDVARFVTTRPGGRGAVREVVEHILKAQNKWDAVLERFGE